MAYAFFSTFMNLLELMYYRSGTLFICPDFRSGPFKKLVVKFQNLLGKIQNLATKFLKGLSQKYGQIYKVPERLFIDFENLK